MIYKRYQQAPKLKRFLEYTAQCNADLIMAIWRFISLVCENRKKSNFAKLWRFSCYNMKITRKWKQNAWKPILSSVSSSKNVLLSFDNMNRGKFLEELGIFCWLEILVMSWKLREESRGYYDDGSNIDWCLKA